MKLIEAHGARSHPFSLVKPHVAAWLAVDQQILGYDTNQDMVLVARCIKKHQQIDAQTLEQETQLPIERLNIAALLLHSEEIVDLIPPAFGSAPYDFTRAVATYKTRRWIREHTNDLEPPREYRFSE